MLTTAKPVSACIVQRICICMASERDMSSFDLGKAVLRHLASSAVCEASSAMPSPSHLRSRRSMRLIPISPHPHLRQ